MFETQKPILNCLSTTQLYSVKEYTITIIAPPPKKKLACTLTFKYFPIFTQEHGEEALP